MIPEITILDWDSAFFNFRIGSLSAASLREIDINSLKKRLEKKQIKLCYLFLSESTDQDKLEKLGAILVDKKTTFLRNHYSSHDLSKITAAFSSESYSGACTPDLYALAREAGRYSRFNLDPRISKDSFIQLYHTWMERCIKRELAKEVFIIKKNRDIIGVIALDINSNNQGTIPLIAVAPNNRNQGIGKLLMTEAILWFNKNGCLSSKVVTQASNQPASRLYSSVGYSLESVIYTYHWWV